MGTRLFKAVRHLSKRVLKQHGFALHMERRPRGQPRHEWALVWLAAHGLPSEIPADVPRKRAVPSKSQPVSKWETFVISDAFLLSAEWRRLRMLVITKRGARCECCGASPKDGVTVINVDHIKPRRNFPQLALVESNLQILCAVCNHGKGNWDQTDWRRDAPVESVALEPEPLTYEEVRPLWWPRLVKTN